MKTIGKWLEYLVEGIQAGKAGNLDPGIQSILFWIVKHPKTKTYKETVIWVAKIGHREALRHFEAVTGPVNPLEWIEDDDIDAFQRWYDRNHNANYMIGG